MEDIDIENKNNIGVYCKCGGLICVCTEDSYKHDRETRREMDSYFDKGFRMGKVSKMDVQQLFGCKCVSKQTELFQ